MDNIIITGDLNVIQNQAEKRGGSLVKDPIREQVDELILDWDLSDVILSKGKFTWTNKRLGLGNIASKLDRFLIQDSFNLLGLNSSSKILPFCNTPRINNLLLISAKIFYFIILIF